MDITHITSLLGGIALFLYGMSIMGAGLEKLAGGKMQGILQKLTSSTIKGVIFGTLITGVIQSSAGTVVICVGLVNSGIMTLTQSVGVIMGANIGTTVTGQLIRMADISGDSLILTLIQPKTFAPVVAFIGCIFYVFIRNAKKKNIGQIMLGFGILFTGMSLMDTGVSPLRESAAFQELFVTMTNPILGVLVGVVVTVIIQSSSASVGILQALSGTGLVTFSSAIPIVLGAHIGTAFTPLLLRMDEDVVSAIDVRENLIDRMEVDISNYLIKLADQELGDAESHEVTELLNFVTECERIGDYAVNIKEKAQELADKEVTFSEKAQQELKLLDNALEKILTLTTDAFEFDEARTASQVEPLEQVIDILVERLRAQHIKRLKDGVCSIDTGVVYLDVLSNVERISDHCSNIAARLVGMEAGEDYDSHTLKNMMHHNPTKEYMLNYEQCRRDYLIPLEQLEA